jgi:hypothetical protein
MSLVRLTARGVALLAALPAYAAAYVGLFARVPDGGRGIDYLAGDPGMALPFAVGASALVVAFVATGVAVTESQTGTDVGVSVGGLLLVFGVAVLALPILAPAVGLAAGAVGLGLFLSGASLRGATV